jgi:DNA-binding PadR family transcriptional regulator
MEPPATLECVLLGLLDQAPRSGYDLRKVFTGTPLKRFSDSPGAIYPALRRLERRGFIAGENARPESGRRRRAFRLTTAGRRAFLEWLRMPPTREDVTWRLDDLKPRFAFMSQGLSHAEIGAFLERLASEIDGYVAELERYGAHVGPMALTARLAFEGGVDEYRACARWAREALACVIQKGRKR